MKIANNVTDLIGNTPLVRINRITQGCAGEVLAKLEFQNPAHSVKDRIGLSMVEAAEKAGLVKPDTIFLEPTSGNTGIGLAMVCAARGYKCAIVMPDTMSRERRMLLRAYGAELILTPGAERIPGAIKKSARNGRSRQALPDSPSSLKIRPIRRCIAQPLRKKSGAIPTARWIFWFRALAPAGTITGVGEVLKARKPSFQCVAVEPDASPVLSGGQAGPHPLQGIGAGFVPKVLNTKVYDEVVRVKNDDAMTMARRMAQEEGLLVGISSGAAMWAAVEVAKRASSKGKMLVVIIPSFGERYLSTPLFAGLAD